MLWVCLMWCMCFRSINIWLMRTYWLNQCCTQNEIWLRVTCELAAHYCIQLVGMVKQLKLRSFKFRFRHFLCPQTTEYVWLIDKTTRTPSRMGCIRCVFNAKFAYVYEFFRCPCIWHRMLIDWHTKLNTVYFSSIY